jgi:hypothetical protein
MPLPNLGVRDGGIEVGSRWSRRPCSATTVGDPSQGIAEMDPDLQRCFVMTPNYSEHVRSQSSSQDSTRYWSQTKLMWCVTTD